jgi:hypothetical protein
MQQTLMMHPGAPSDAASGIVATASRPRAGILALRYRVSGDIGALSLPDEKPAARADELWRHTCFEAFVRPAGGAAYIEFNFAPSTEWAAYCFKDYRDGMAAARNVGAPAISVQRARDFFELRAEIEITGADFCGDALWRLGLSAVIKEKSGRLSYWALAHPAGKPDFHHADCFTLELAPPLRP